MAYAKKVLEKIYPTQKKLWQELFWL